MVALTRSQTRTKREDGVSRVEAAEDVQTSTSISQPEQNRPKLQLEKTVSLTRNITEPGYKGADLPPPVSQPPIPTLDETSQSLRPAPNASKALAKESHSLSTSPPDPPPNRSYDLSPASHPASDLTQTSSDIAGAPPNSPDNSYNLSPASHPASDLTQTSSDLVGAPPNSPGNSYNLSPASHPASDITQTSSDIAGAPPNSPNNSYNLSPASHPASDLTQTSSDIGDAPPNSPHNSYNLSPPSHLASVVTQSSPRLRGAPPNTPQLLHNISQDVQSSPQFIQSPLQCPGVLPSTPPLSRVNPEDLSDTTHSLPQTPEAPPNSPFSSPEGPNAPNNSPCRTAEVHSEVAHSPWQNVGLSCNPSEGLPASLTASPHRIESIAEPPSSPPELIETAPKNPEGSSDSVDGSQCVCEPALQLPSSVPELSQSPSKGPGGSAAGLVTSPKVNVSESEPVSPSRSIVVSQSPPKNQDRSPTGSIPNTPEGSPTSLVHSAYVSEASLHGSDNQVHIPSSSNGSLVDTQISPRPLQQSSQVFCPGFGWYSSGLPLPNQSVPCERVDYSSDIPRDPPEQISSDKILWDASETPREAPIVVRDLYPESTSPEIKLEVATPTMVQFQQNETEHQDDNRRAISPSSGADDAGSFMSPPVEPLAGASTVRLTVDALNRFNAAQLDDMEGDSSDDDDLDYTRVTEFPQYARVEPRIIQDYHAFFAEQQEAGSKEFQQNEIQHQEDNRRAISPSSGADDAGSFMSPPVEPLAGASTVRLTVDALNRFNAAQPDDIEGDSSDDDDLDYTRVTEFPQYARVEPRIIQDYHAFFAGQQETGSMRGAAETPDKVMAIEPEFEWWEGEEGVRWWEHEEDARLNAVIADALLDADIPSEIDIQEDISDRFKPAEAAEFVESWIIKSLPPRAHDLLMYTRRDISSDMCATLFLFQRQLMRTPIDERNPSLMCLRPGCEPISPIMTSQEHISNLKDEENFLMNRFKKGGGRRIVKRWNREMEKWFDKHLGKQKGSIGARFSVVLDEVEGVAVAYINGEQEDDREEKASILRRLSQYDPDGSPGPRFDFEHAVRHQRISGIRPGENDYPKEHRLLGTDYARNHLLKRLRREPEDMPADNLLHRQEEGQQLSLPVLPVNSNLRVWPHHPARFRPHRPERHSRQEGLDSRPDTDVNVPDKQHELTHKRRRSDGARDEHYDQEHKRSRAGGVGEGH